MKRQTANWEKIFTKDTFDKGLLSEILKKLLSLKTKNKKIN